MSYEQTTNTSDRSTQARRNLLRRVEALGADDQLLNELEGWLDDAEVVGRRREYNKTYMAYRRTSGTSGPTRPTKHHTLSFLKEEEEKSTKLVSTNVDTRLAQPDDPRTTLFRVGVKTLMEITGKTESSTRSLIGRWLKGVDDEAIHVLGAIEDAARERVADPVPWITKSLQKHGRNGNGTNGATRPKTSKEQWGEMLQSLGSGEFWASVTGNVPNRESGGQVSLPSGDHRDIYYLPVRSGEKGGDANGHSSEPSDLFADGRGGKSVAE